MALKGSGLWLRIWNCRSKRFEEKPKAAMGVVQVAGGPLSTRCSLSGSTTPNERGCSPRGGNKAGTERRWGLPGAGVGWIWSVGRMAIWGRKAGRAQCGPGPLATRRDQWPHVVTGPGNPSHFAVKQWLGGLPCREWVRTGGKEGLLFASQEERNRPPAAESQWIAVTSAMSQSRSLGHSQI